MPITQVEKIWMDGELVDWADAKIHVLSHALHYGTGVFEGIRAYETARGPAVWHMDEHLRRLYRSAKLYHMDIPFSVEAIGEGMKDVIRANGLRSCYIRPLVIRGYGEMGVNPLNAPVNVIIAVWPWGAYLGEDALEQGVRIKISSWRRNGQNSLPAAAKATGQYINSVLAKVESVKAGYDEAVMLNEQGFITDGSGENVFIVRGGALTTPPTQAGCLDGITRGIRDPDRARPRVRGPRGEPGPQRPLQRGRVLLLRARPPRSPRSARWTTAPWARAIAGRSRRSCRARSSRRRRARPSSTPTGSPTSTDRGVPPSISAPRSCNQRRDAASGRLSAPGVGFPAVPR